MRIAFYAPLKPPDHPVPSGDRTVGSLLMLAMRLAGHEVELANRLRSRDGEGDADRQERLQRIGRSRADRLIRRYSALPKERRPELWFTYHLYYKAPDWVGPRVAAKLGIPYVVAEASVAPKRAGGPWDVGHQATLDALEQASLVLALNPDDVACLPDPERVRILRPFTDVSPFQKAATARARHRNSLAARLALDPEWPWLTAIAMMRPGDKLASYRLLAEALHGLRDRPWHLILVGGGPARAEVEAAFAPLSAEPGPQRVHLLGEVPPEELPAIAAACDLLVWPAINEAFGMALLEAQAAGLPVVAGRSGGVAAVVREHDTGLLALQGDREAFRRAVSTLLHDPAKRRAMAERARERAAAEHALPVAARRLDAILAEAQRIGARPAAPAVAS